MDGGGGSKFNEASRLVKIKMERAWFLRVEGEVVRSEDNKNYPIDSKP